MRISTSSNAQGYSPTIDEFEEYAKRPARRGATYTGGVFETSFGVLSTLQHAFRGTKEAVPAESIGRVVGAGMFIAADSGATQVFGSYVQLWPSEHP